MELKAGSRWKSVVSDTEIIIVRAPAAAAELCCGGVPMIATDALRPDDAPTVTDGETLLGKRYGDDTIGIELLCTKGGAGELSIDGNPVPQKDAKPLPSSD